MDKNKTIHILGGGQWQLYTVKMAKKLGYRVLVTDMYSERPAYEFADLHEVVDITDKETTLEISRRYQVDGIVCDTTDVGVPTMAYVAEKMGLPGMGYETALNFTDKVRMRELSLAAGVPNPAFTRCRTLEECFVALDRIGYPAMIKPVDSQSSRGVFKVANREQLAIAFVNALNFSREKAVIIEQYLNGVEITVESACVDGRVITIGVSDKDHFIHNPTVANRLTYPAALPESVLNHVCNVNSLTVQTLGLKNGIAHAEFFIVDDEPYLVEIAARGGGSHVYSHIVPFLAGQQLNQNYLEYIVGSAFSCTFPSEKRAANLAFFDFPAGRVCAINGVEDVKKIPGVELLLLEFNVGDVIQSAVDDRSRLGQVVIFGNSREEVLSTTRLVQQTIQVEVAPI